MSVEKNKTFPEIKAKRCNAINQISELKDVVSCQLGLKLCSAPANA